MEANAEPPKGNAAWVYDTNSSTAQVASWADWIALYNRTATIPHRISTVYSYGGDMSYYPNTSDPFKVSFPDRNQNAAKIYKTVLGVKQVVLTIDGQMNGGGEGAPNLAALPPSQVQAWANQVSKTYCLDFVDGVQIDLEPARAPYLENLLIFLKQLSSQLAQCKNTDHPNGRSLGVFMGAGAATPEMFKAIGPNGYVVLSGYDLSDAPAGTVTDPVKYGQALQGALNLVARNAVASNGYFTVGIPAAASVHEFTQLVPASGAPTIGFPMYSVTGKTSYLTEAMKVIAPFRSKLNFLGVSLWGFAHEMSNPVGSRNLYYPSMPFQQAGEFTYLQKNL